MTSDDIRRIDDAITRATDCARTAAILDFSASRSGFTIQSGGVEVGQLTGTLTDELAFSASPRAVFSIAEVSVIVQKMAEGLNFHGAGVPPRVSIELSPDGDGTIIRRFGKEIARLNNGVFSATPDGARFGRGDLGAIVKEMSC